MSLLDDLRLNGKALASQGVTDLENLATAAETRGEAEIPALDALAKARLAGLIPPSVRTFFGSWVDAIESKAFDTADTFLTSELKDGLAWALARLDAIKASLA